MITIQDKGGSTFCDGVSRRDFMRVGALGMGGLTLPGLLHAKSSPGGVRVKNKSVIWVWLAGGPTHVETFDPKMTAPAEYRSITGECKTPIPGVTVGGTFPEIASVADKMALVSGGGISSWGEPGEVLSSSALSEAYECNLQVEVTPGLGYYVVPIE